MHADPSRPWTVEQLAKKAALSRSALFDRFTRSVGLPPMEYLLAWRMAVAKDMLRRQEVGIAEVAERVGYGSASTAELGKSKLRGPAGKQCVACLSYVFNHHERDLAERLTSMQHDHHNLTISTMHAHLDHDHCLETVILRGPTASVTQFADEVCAQRAVHHGQLNIIGVELHEPHGERKAKAGAAPHVHLKPAT